MGARRFWLVSSEKDDTHPRACAADGESDMRAAFSALLVMQWLVAAPAHSADKWVSSSGSGTACTRSAPCASPTVALTAANDSIHCVDAGVFPALSAGFLFSLSCAGAEMVMRPITLWGNAASDVSVLEGISIICDSPVQSAGISFGGSGTLIVRNVRITNCGVGIQYQPYGPSSLVMRNVNIENNTYGLYATTFVTTAKIQIEDTQFVHNTDGAYIFAQEGCSFDVEIRNSTLSQNSNFGLLNIARVGVSVVFVDNSSLMENGNLGIYSTGAYSYVLANRSTIARNYIGWAFADGGTLATFGTNVVNNKSAYGGPSVSAALQ